MKVDFRPVPGKGNGLVSEKGNTIQYSEAPSDLQVMGHRNFSACSRKSCT